jgi:DNA-binding transcriptional ArsR family regulator
VQDAVKAIANPYRREILRLVWDRELPSGDIATRFDVTWPSISRNLKVLREAGLIHERRDGTMRYYRADRKALKPLEPMLKQMWATGLDRLAKLAHTEEKRGRR